MDEIEHTNKIKILEELQKNGRASVSDIADKTGLTRQTVAKIISNMEKNKEIWGYSAIFDPKLIGLKPFIIQIKLDLSVNFEDFLKKATSKQRIKENEEKYLVQTSMFIHGKSDFMFLFWAKDIIEAKNMLNTYYEIYQSNVKETDLSEVIISLRNCGIANPNLVQEFKKGVL